MDEAEPEHVLEAAARAGAGGLLTEVVVGALALALTVWLGGQVPDDRAQVVLAHAVGTGLGAAAALLAAERLALQRWWLGLLAGLALCGLAPLGGWYVRDLVAEHDVRKATEGVVDALRGFAPGAGLLVAGVALCGYGAALLARRRGAGLVTQAVLGAWALAAFGVAALLAVPGELERFPALAYGALALARAVTLPLAMALGARAGAALLRRLRGEAPPRPGAVRLPPSLVAVRAALLLPLLGAAWALLGACPFEPGDVTGRRLAALLTWDDDALVDLGHELAARRLRGVDVNVLPWAVTWPPPPSPVPPRPLLAGPVDVAVEGAEALVLPLHASAVACLRGPARARDVDAMLLLAGVLARGTRLRPPPVEDRWATWRWEPYAPTLREEVEARAWLRRASEAREAGGAVRRLGDAVELVPLARRVAGPDPALAVRCLRPIARRQAAAARELHDVLLQHPALRRPELDVVLRTGMDGRSARSLDVSRLSAAVRAPAARPEDPVDLLALAAWYLRAAFDARLDWFHLDVADSYVQAAEPRAPDDLEVLLLGALRSAGRALIDPDGDLGSARHARARLLAAELLHPDAAARVAEVRGAVEELLGSNGLGRDTTGPAGLDALADELARRQTVSGAPAYGHAAQRVRAARHDNFGRRP